MPQLETQPIVAYRAWEYLPGPRAPRIAAVVMKHRAAVAPMGLDYAFKTMADLAQCFDHVVPGTTIIFGRVAIAGRVAETARGYHVQFAYPQVFYLL
jgi:hypothetical protein